MGCKLQVVDALLFLCVLIGGFIYLFSDDPCLSNHDDSVCYAEVSTNICDSLTETVNSEEDAKLNIFYGQRRIEDPTMVECGNVNCPIEIFLMDENRNECFKIGNAFGTLASNISISPFNANLIAIAFGTHMSARDEGDDVYIWSIKERTSYRLKVNLHGKNGEGLILKSLKWRTPTEIEYQIDGNDRVFSTSIYNKD